MSLMIKQTIKNKRIVLASASPRRKELMKYIASDFEIIPSDAEEVTPEGTPTEKIPQILAELKCREVCKRCQPNENTIVIGCDTLVISPDGEPMGKPKDDADALRMLKTLRGREHAVVSGVCVYFKGEFYGFSQRTSVRFRNASDKELDEYVKSGEPRGKAGAYAIQGQGALLIEGFSGDFNNVVGLPVTKLAEELAKIVPEDDNGA